jgi:gluconate 5-dehydrogenase
VEDIFDISGKTALITGSTRGIGRALAQGLAAAHSRILIHGRDAARAEDAASALRAEQGADAIACAFDVTSPEQVEHGIRRIEEEIGDIDILVNNAGIQRRAPFADFPVPDWDEVLATNLTSAFLVSRQVAKSMIRRGRGKIVNIGSVQSQLGRPGITPYAASKGGLVMLTRGMCADLAPYGIQVNAIAPGYFRTDLTQPLAADPEFDAWIRRRTPAGRWGDVRELAGTLRYLVSPAADFVNGQIIYVDGGMTAVV